MKLDDRERFVDELLEATLRGLGTAEPRSGLESRILAGALAGERRARQRAWVWALGAAAAGLAVLAVVLSLPRRQHVPLPKVTPLPVPLATSAPAVPPAALVGERSALPLAGRARPYRAPRVTLAAGRPDQFPTPVPLTQEEKLLLAFVAAVPKSQLLAVREQAQDIEVPDLNVAALDIKPLPGSIDEQER